MIAGTSVAVIQHDVKAAGHRDDELLQSFVRMPATLCAAGHVVQVIDALDIEGYVTPGFHCGQIAALVMHDRQRHHAAATGEFIMRHPRSAEAWRFRRGLRLDHGMAFIR